MAFMVKTKTVMAFVAIAALMGAADVAAQSADCGAGSMTPCLTYAAGNDSEPSGECCTAFATVVAMNASCLCQVLTGNDGIPNFNQTKALALPTECNVLDPTLSSCAVADAGTMFTPSMVVVISMAALVLIKIII